MFQSSLPDEWLEQIAQNRLHAGISHTKADRHSRLIPVLNMLAGINDERILITVDGPCGSGKSTLAAELAQVIGADVVHMDDFVIPHALKTAERLALPGGNADIERLMSEAVTPWMAHGYASYRPYLCHEDAYGIPVEIRSQSLIVEGSYANLPQLREVATARLFVSVPPHEQLARLLQRVGPERIGMFEQKWIPLERAYFAHYALPDAGCIPVSAYYDQAE